MERVSQEYPPSKGVVTRFYPVYPVLTRAHIECPLVIKRGAMETLPFTVYDIIDIKIHIFIYRWFSH